MSAIDDETNEEVLEVLFEVQRSYSETQDPLQSTQELSPKSQNDELQPKQLSQSPLSQDFEHIEGGLQSTQLHSQSSYDGDLQTNQLSQSTFSQDYEILEDQSSISLSESGSPKKIPIESAECHLFNDPLATLLKTWNVYESYEILKCKLCFYP